MCVYARITPALSFFLCQLEHPLGAGGEIDILAG